MLFKIGFRLCLVGIMAGLLFSLYSHVSGAGPDLGDPWIGYNPSPIQMKSSRPLAKVV